MELLDKRVCVSTMPYERKRPIIIIIIIIIVIITYSKEQNPSWEANQFSADQEIRRIW